MEATTTQEWIGKRVSVKWDDNVSVTCEVLDTLKRFGRTDLLVTPVVGTGTRWVNSENALEVQS